MTDREKLAKLVLRCGVELGDVICDECGRRPLSDSCVAIADHLIANGVTFANDTNDGGKWIPVTERMPEPMKFVLCACRCNIIEVMRYCTKRAGWDPMSEDRLYMKGFVTHWMPLPAPPEE